MKSCFVVIPLLLSIVFGATPVKKYHQDNNANDFLLNKDTTMQEPISFYQFENPTCDSLLNTIYPDTELSKMYSCLSVTVIVKTDFGQMIMEFSTVYKKYEVQFFMICFQMVSYEILQHVSLPKLIVYLTNFAVSVIFGFNRWRPLIAMSPPSLLTYSLADTVFLEPMFMETPLDPYTLFVNSSTSFDILKPIPFIPISGFLEKPLKPSTLYPMPLPRKDTAVAILYPSIFSSKPKIPVEVIIETLFKYYIDFVFSPFLPSNNRYYELNLPTNTALNKEEIKSETKPESKSEAKSKEDKLRFGLGPLNYGGTGNGGGYGNGGYGLTSTKIDLGGVVIGALIGFGAVLLLPKFAQIFSAHHGNYRGLDEDNFSVALNNFLKQMDNTLEENKIDKQACIQNMVCEFVGSLSNKMNNGTATPYDELIVSFAKNTLINYMMPNELKQAMDMGLSAENNKCNNFALKCNIKKEQFDEFLSKFQ